MAVVLGWNIVKQNLRNFSKMNATQLSRGLVLAGRYLQRMSMTYVPVDEGNLRLSAYTHRVGVGYQTVVYVGYTAKYAIYVHEILHYAHGKDFNIKYSREIAENRPPVPPRKVAYFRLRGEMQQAKFLEKPFKENRAEMLAIIAGQAMIV